MKRRKFIKTVIAGGATLMLPVNRLSFANSITSRGDLEGLEAGFVSPPDSAKAHTWWHWMNGNVTKEGITRDLEAMREAGLGGFHAFHVTDRILHGPVDYASESWHQLMEHTIQKAAGGNRVPHCVKKDDSNRDYLDRLDSFHFDMSNRIFQILCIFKILFIFNPIFQ